MERSVPNDVQDSHEGDRWLMSDRDHYDECCRRFDALFRKFELVDEAIRGNGKPGIIVRLDRLEQRAKWYTHAAWMLAGAVVTAAIGWVAS